MSEEKCPYCSDAVLEDIEESDTVKMCENEGNCDATFVAVIN